MAVILTERRDRILTVTVNRPEKLNALNGEVVEGLREAFHAAKNDADIGAVIVTGSDESEIGPVVWGSDETHIDAIRIEGRNGTFFQEGQTVFRWATTKIGAVAIRAAQAAGVDLADVDVLVTHQANLRIIDAIAKRVIAAGARHELKVARDIVTSGNTSSASIPLALDRMRAAGEVSSGDVVLSVAFGAGLTYAGQVFLCP